jgi:peptidoglycan hydrolase-like protein with peptidoglycan-binding domain
MGDRGKLSRLGKYFSLYAGAVALSVVLAFGVVSSNAATVPPNNSKLTTHTELLVNKKVLPMLTEQSAGQLESLAQRYRDIVSDGGFPKVPNGTYKKGKQHKSIAILNRRLYLEGYLRVEATKGEYEQVYTSATEEAVRRYQRNLGLEPSGKIDVATLKQLNVTAAQRLRTIEANIQRLREYAKDLGSRYLVVNVPSQQIEAVSGGYVYSRHNAVVGREDRPTPVVATALSDVIFNPYWNAPASIVERDLIPKLLSDRNVLREMNIKVFQGYGGPEVDPRKINWRRVVPDDYHFRQEPGEGNAMATAKINFSSPFGIYLHDTPDKVYFTTNHRLYSSGCVRVDKVAILLDWILNGQDGLGAPEIAAYAETLENREVKLAEPPQLRVTYLTAWPVGNTVAFRDDVYDLDNSGFIVGQPMPVGELSDEGQRFVLKPVPRQPSVVDEDEFGGFTLFSRHRNKQNEFVDTVNADGTATPRKRRTFFGGLYEEDLGSANAAKKKTATADEPVTTKKKLKKSKNAPGVFDWQAHRKSQKAASTTAKKKPVETKEAAKKADDTKAVAKKPTTIDAKKKAECKPGSDGKLPKDCPAGEAATKKPAVQDDKKKPDCKLGADGKLPKGCPVEEAAQKKPKPASATATN